MGRHCYAANQNQASDSIDMQPAATESAFRRVLRNAGYLLGGKAAGTALHFAALAVASRALGPEQFGTVVLIHAFAQTAGGLATFQTWQTLIRYGTTHLIAGRRQSLQRLIAFGTWLDLGTGLLAMLAAVAVLAVLGDRTGIPAEFIGTTMLYCLVIPTMASSTASGLLRLFDRFGLLAMQSSVNGGLRLLGVAFAALADAPLVAYVAAWFLSDLLADLLIWAFAIRETRRRGLLKGMSGNPRGVMADNPRLWRFAFATNASTGVATLLGPALTLLVGALLGPAAAGLFRIALTVIEAAAKPGDLLTRAFFPEIARLKEQGQMSHFWSVTARITGLSLGFAAIVVMALELAGRPLLALAFGAGYEGAQPILVLMAYGLIAALPLFFLEAALVALDQAEAALVARGFGAIASFTVLGTLSGRYGLAAAGYAYVAGTAVVATLALVLLWRRRPVQPVALR